MNDAVNIFLNNTFTTSDIKRRLILLKVFIYSKFFGSTFTSSDYDPADFSWLQSLGNGFFKQFTSTNATIILSKLEDELKQLPVLIVYVPFEMPETEFFRLGNWLKTNLGSNFIFETRIDPDLIGGTALSWKGIYKDLSLRETLLENRNQILESFKEFING